MLTDIINQEPILHDAVLGYKANLSCVKYFK